MRPFAPHALALTFVVLVGCSKGSSGSSGSASSAGSAGSAAGPPGSYLTVDAYCTAFCGKLCGTCGDAGCKDACTPTCQHGRTPTMVMDGKDPKVALARTQSELDACLATITKDSCAALMGGQVPPACFTIQH